MNANKKWIVETHYTSDKLNLFGRGKGWPRLTQHIKKYGLFRGLKEYFSHRQRFRLRLIAERDFYSNHHDDSYKTSYIYNIKRLKNGKIAYKSKEGNFSY